LEREITEYPDKRSIANDPADGILGPMEGYESSHSKESQDYKVKEKITYKITRGHSGGILER
jgi:hypothetical protein